MSGSIRGRGGFAENTRRNNSASIRRIAVQNCRKIINHSKPTIQLMSSYQSDALRTLSSQFHIGDDSGVTPDLLHGAIGLATESGEMLDAVKRALFYGAELDRTNLVEELGDLEWYMAVLRDALNVTQEEVQRINIDKLRARYPEKFSTEHALDRDLDRERAVLDDGLVGGEPR